MSTTSETLAIARAKRHCAGYGCRKCAARARWSRRKGWRSRKSPSPITRARKR